MRARRSIVRWACQGFSKAARVDVEAVRRVGDAIVGDSVVCG